jgi:putative DNA primase/helicase
MSYVNYDDALNQIRDAGLIVDKTVSFDARIQRWKVDGEDREKRGWTKLREWTSKAGHTYIVGAYGVWRGNDDGYTKIELGEDSASALTKEDKAAIKAAHKEAERKLAEVRKAEIKKASQWSATVWSKCAPCEAHDYLTIKQIKPHGLRILPENIGDMTLAGIDDSNFFRLKSAAGALVVPMHDAKGVVQGLQFIYAKGHPRRIKIERDKEFWPSGMAMGGTFGLIGPVRRSGIMLITEGYATAASLHECTGQTVAYAFSANNLIKAGKQLAKEYGGLHILFCADDDYLTEGNPGCTAAANASAEIERSAWIKPVFPKNSDDTDARNGKKLTDFNDLYCSFAVPFALAEQINAKLDELKWKDTPTLALSARGGVQPQGGGESIARTTLKSMLTIDEAAERFALVYGGKSTIFDYQEHILVPKADVLDILPEHGWRDLRSIKKVVRMEEVGFDPACTDKRILCNLWGGWPTVPKQGRCESLIELLEYLCSEEENYRVVFDWVIKWIAYPIQHPGAKMRTALIFHGPQGTGKNLFFEAVMAIYGEYGRIVDQAAIEDKFNDWASRKLLMLADEVVARQELYHVKNKLKSFVTGEWIRINPKNVAAHDERNHVNLVFMSNESQPLVLEKDDRRYTVIHTPEKLPPEFYQQVRDELNNGGIAALHHYLLNIDLGDFDEHTKPPMTKAKENLIDVSLDSVQRFIAEWSAGDIESAPFCPCLGRHLFAVYRKWCDQLGERSPRSEAQFIGHIRNLHRWKAGEAQATFETLNSSARKTRKMIVPPDDYASSRIAVSKEGKTQQLWLTECFFEFANAAGFEV